MTEIQLSKKIIEASAQTIEVPPHKKYKADVVLEQRNFWGDITLTAFARDLKITIKETAGYIAPNGMVDSKKYTFEEGSGAYYKKLIDSHPNRKI
ncbi:ETX/MTX2 family pore-forming toxin [Bacillus thuringiensis]|uniref:Uncharacterized protein n=1 Tax=Bacillus thuringiensis TaxID=1428 RepID=A0A1B2RCF3_BACTU|nr:ETX/MTX2 family pore-forming toxin [Bacillus thuringiensis]AOB42253.1 hypothetical protein pFR260_156 [Bacillus thuringiensis]MBN9901179.1 hypothetical protein [Bacillus thuringiensis]MDY7521560.1 ETX/MTX2 family pore-forming toxin [Bacillus thuringiensis]OMH24044.1 hypothetical protein BUM91_30725 [Bacillus thuringiensis]OTX85447.1 hypothetical protein BK726_18675 [Bacillus thuringiensis serovar londrina]